MVFTISDHLHVEGLELIGDTHAPEPVALSDDHPAPGFTEQSKMMIPEISEPAGHGVIKDVSATTGGGISPRIDKREQIHGYSSDNVGRRGRRGAFYLGPTHVGTMRFVDCHIEEFGSHGIYGSAAGGAIQVEGCVWRNNDNSQIRISGPESFITDARIEVDVSQIDADSPTELAGGYRGIKGIWWQAKRESQPGGFVEDCDIYYTDYPAVTSSYIDGEFQIDPNTQPSDAIHMRSRGPAITVRDTGFPSFPTAHRHSKHRRPAALTET